jgi:hypothetical protein
MMHLAVATLALMSTGTSNICTTQACVVYAETAADLYQIDPVQLTQTYLCAFSGVDGAVNDIAIDANGNLYGLTADTLYKVNPTTCAASVAANVKQVSSTFNGLSFLIDGRLIAADTSGNVVQIDPSTGGVNQVGTYGGNLGSSGDIVALSTGTIYATAIDSSSTSDILVTLDPTTFKATRVGPITGYSQIYGLGYWAGVLYGFDSNGDVLTINPATGAATVAISNSGLSWYGAGTTPLAPTTCTDACAAGSTQCDASGELETCETQDDGCLDWSSGPCGAGLTCSGGQCVATCTSDCIPFTSQCDSSGNLQTCTLEPSGCLNWVSAPCDSTEVCTGGKCVGACSNQCNPNQVSCTGNTVQVCEAQGDGCYAWVDSTMCTSGELCSGGNCVTTCTDVCTSGATQCSGSFIQTCGPASSGCTDWQNGSDCGAVGCVDGACCACLPGQTQCVGDSLQTCSAGAVGACAAWVTQPCQSGTCMSGACLAACNPGSELNTCGVGAQCLPMGGGYYCGSTGADGGFVPATSGGSGTGSSTEGAASSAAGAGTSGSSGAASGPGGVGAGATAGSNSGAAGSAGSGGANGTSGTNGAGAAGGSAGSSTGATTSSKPETASGSGCGCGSTDAGALMELGFALVFLRRRLPQAQ